jgi:HK97 gp10 family phage protein
MELRIEVKGLREIQRNLLDLPARVTQKKILDAGLLVAGRMVADEARLFAPELRTTEDPRWTRGALKRAIRAARIRPSEFAAEVVVSVKNVSANSRFRFKARQISRKNRGKSFRRVDPRDAYYWFFQEFGTARMRARPFLRPAFEARKEPAIAAAIAQFEKLIAAEMQKMGRTLN